MPRAPIITPTSPMVMTAVAPAPLSDHVFGEASAGMTVPTTPRSKPSSRTAIQQGGETQSTARAVVASEVVDAELTSSPCGLR
jgi:hypothetical protein